MFFILDPTTAAVSSVKTYVMHYSGAIQPATIMPSRKMLEGEELIIEALTGYEWSPVTKITTEENPAGVALNSRGTYRVSKTSTISPLGAIVDG